jgi:glyoxylase-like metal-dependent hydrolase (beta-lactamase superfamily II)
MAAEALAPVTDLGAGMHQIRLPMAGNPMRYINGYLIAEDDGATLVDCGWRADDVLDALHAGLAHCGLRLADVARVVITHAHFDHYGLAGTLRRNGLRELLMHPAEWEFAKQHFTDIAEFDRIADEWIERNGFAADYGEVAEEDIDHHRVELTAPTSLVEDGARIGRLRAIWTPGHTTGHLCFIDEQTGRMLTGDHVLDPVTPHVGSWSPNGTDRIGNYIASLEKVNAIGATGVLPAHGEPWTDLAPRVDALIAHEYEREARIISLLERGPASAGDIARALTWTRKERSFDSLAMAHQQFAVAETLAHLEHLWHTNRATRDDSGSIIHYTLRAS